MGANDVANRPEHDGFPAARAAKDQGISASRTPAAADRPGIHRRPKTQQQRAQSGGLPSCWHGGSLERPSGSAVPGDSPSAAATRHMRTRTLMVKPSPGRLPGRRPRPMARATRLLLRENICATTALPPEPPASPRWRRAPPRPTHDSLCQVPTVICQHLNIQLLPAGAWISDSQPGRRGVSG